MLRVSLCEKIGGSFKNNKRTNVCISYSTMNSTQCYWYTSMWDIWIGRVFHLFFRFMGKRVRFNGTVLVNTYKSAQFEYLNTLAKPKSETAANFFGWVEIWQQVRNLITYKYSADHWGNFLLIIIGIKCAIVVW